MDKAHDVQSLSFSGTMMYLRVDDKDYEIDISKQPKRLTIATQEQRENYVISPAGYGIHWQDIDEDLSIDGFIGVKHTFPLEKKRA